MPTSRKTAGDHLREWRGKRRMSQLELASGAPSFFEACLASLDDQSGPRST
jgi:hypothetical protein